MNLFGAPAALAEADQADTLGTVGSGAAADGEGEA
jgi:hypothetical protein